MAETSPADREGAATPAPKGKLLKADDIAIKYRPDIEASIAAFTRRKSSSGLSRKPKLVGILATDSKPSASYAEFTKKTCDGIGVEFVLKKVGSALVSENGPGLDGDGIEEAIIEANEDDGIDGVMVYYPIFGGLQDHYLQQTVSPFKDVEGLHSKFHFHLYHNIRFIRPESLNSSIPLALTAQGVVNSEVPPEGMVKSIIPCTPLAIIKCLEYMGVYNMILSYGDRAYGKTVTVINRSEVVGRPLAALLSNDGARVFSVDIDSILEYTKRPKPPASSHKVRPGFYTRHVVHPTTMTLEECLAISDAVVTAVPSAEYKVKTDWLKDGCVCVNVSSERNFSADVRDKASLYLPSVGKVTILMLLRNLMRLCEYRKMLVDQPGTKEESTSTS